MVRKSSIGLLLFASCLAVAAQSTASQPLTVEQIFAHGPMIGAVPSGLTWSPDARHLTYLEAGELIDIDPATAKAHVMVSRAKLASLSGAQGSEVDRDHRDRYHMASYLWTPDSAHLVFDANGRLWLWDLHNSTGVEIASSGAASGDDPKLSPDGKALSFLKEHSLAVIHFADPGSPTEVVAQKPNDSTTMGEMDWVYAEELGVRSNYFWSPDSKRLAFLEMNEFNVPAYGIEEWLPAYAEVKPQRYPQAGDKNPEVRVGVVSARGGRTVWVKLPIKPGDDYIPRFGWADAKTLWIETLARDHQHQTLWFADAASGLARQALEITDPKFIDESYEMFVGEGRIVLSSWQDGHNHLYLYRYDKGAPGAATLERQLTQGDFETGEVLSIDLEAGQIVYASNEGAFNQQQIWQTDFAGHRHALTTTPGWHMGNFAPSGTAFVDRFSTRATPPELSICKAPGDCKVFWKSHALDAYQIKGPERFELKAKDGTALHATIQLPASTGAASVPLIVNPYGGPGGDEVADRWSDSLLFDTLLTQHGFAVLHAENRGTAARGRDFAQAAYRNFGPVQFEDQLTAIDATLARYPQLDAKRLGWWGWSWGGSFTLYAMTHSDRFRAGVAVAPVTDFRLYDSVYTERYLGLPQQNAEVYRQASVQASAAQLKGHLLLVHGTSDDNVHPQNTVQFIQKLIEAGQPYDLQLYPGKTHSIAGPDVRTHLYTRILSHFETYLKSAQP